MRKAWFAAKGETLSHLNNKHEGHYAVILSVTEK